MCSTSTPSHTSDKPLQCHDSAMRISPSPSHAGVGPPPHRHRRPPLSPFLPLLIPHLLSLSLLLVLLTPTFARETPLPSRAFTPLSDTALRDIVALDPPEWSSVTDGHLGKLLIPRACERRFNSRTHPSLFHCHDEMEYGVDEISWLREQVCLQSHGPMAGSK
jgi:hypothetical protein